MHFYELSFCWMSFGARMSQRNFRFHHLLHGRHSHHIRDFATKQFTQEIVKHCATTKLFVILNHLLMRSKQNRNTIDLILKFFVAIITRSFLSQLAMPLESCVRSCIKSRQWPNKESTLASSIQVTLY